MTLTRLHFVFDTGNQVVRVSVKPGDLQAFVQIGHRDIAIELTEAIPNFSAMAQQRAAASIANRALAIYYTRRSGRLRKAGAK